MNKENDPLNFIFQIIEKDNLENKYDKKIHTRFPPEPNGYLHIGHAKSICLNFELAQKYKGLCNLRFDDTNPLKEEVEYINSIKEDIKWLGYDWEDREYFTSDYFEQLYELAIELIKQGKAYVCDQTSEEIKQNRGNPSEAGKESPYRNRSIETNIALFQRMKQGEFKEGEKIVRAKIDMASPNMHLRDPAIYRILKTSHHRTNDTWNVYPMYDFAHGLSDSFEGITHSICTLEFEVHRPLYEWINHHLTQHQPQQIEFARLNLSYTIMSKRKLLELIQKNFVSGWDDPRMPTISGLRRRGYTPEAIKKFCTKIGISKRETMIDVSVLEHYIREDLNKKAQRIFAVLHPIKLIITNYPEDKEEELVASNNPEDETMGKRKLKFSRTLFIERDDFQEAPPKKYFRLSPGKEVRLMHAYIIKCTDFKKNEKGEITEIYCEYDPNSKSGSGTEASKRKVKGTLHWVSASHSIKTNVKLYDRLFIDETPDSHKNKDFKEFINTDSLKIIENCQLEKSIKTAKKDANFQFIRHGYFCLDTKKADTYSPMVFNQTISLRDTWKTKKKK